MSIASALLDMNLALRRVLKDLAERRAFWRHPFEDALIQMDRAQWLDRIRSELEIGSYRPDQCSYVPVPKAGGQIRPGAVLTLRDQVVYSALVQSMRPEIQASLSNGDASATDFSYRLRSNCTDTSWFERFFTHWRDFDRRSAELARSTCGWVVVADVAGCYEHIDLASLRSDLNAVGANSQCVDVLFSCLNRWARSNGRGLPQGFSPSDVLAKLYLHQVDRHLSGLGFKHLRWVDDFRLFASSVAEARRGLAELSEILGRRGLVLQSAKSQIVSYDNAVARFETVPLLLGPVHSAVAQALNIPQASLPPVWEIDDLLSDDTSSVAVRQLVEALMRYFADDEQFNKTLFHFLLRRLAAARNPSGFDVVLRVFNARPEECDKVAEYCSAVGVSQSFEDACLDGIDSGEMPYEYLHYQFLRWRIREARALSSRLRVHTLRWSKTSNSFPVRSAARALLGRFGEAADLEHLQAQYANAASALERAELVCCVQRMEVQRRNAWFARIIADGSEVAAAIQMAKSQSVNWQLS